MSSSIKSSSNSASQGNCVVCGKETLLRCGECAKAGTEYIFFCGKEHQKMIWYMHRKVCGAHSNPFLLPGLSEKEIKDTVEISSKPYYDREDLMHNDRSKRKRWLDDLKWRKGVEPDSDASRLSRLEASVNKLRDTPTSTEGQSLLFELRAGAHRCRANIADSNHSDADHYLVQEAIKHPFDWLAHSVFVMLGDDLAKARKAPWFNRFLHLILILIATVLRICEKGDRSAHSVGRFEYPICQLERFLSDTIEGIQPKTRAFILSYLRYLREGKLAF